MNCVTCNNPLLEGAAYCPAFGARQPWAPDPSLQPAPTYSAFISYRHVPRDAEEMYRYKTECYRRKPVAPMIP